MDSVITKPMANKRVAVVGAGLAGLVAAYQLLQSGAEVTVFEKSSAPGGRAGTVIKDGFHINQGPHALYQAGIAYKFLAQIGARPKGAPPSGRGLALLGGHLYDLPVDAGSLLRTQLFGFSPLAKLELAIFFQKLASVDCGNIMHVGLRPWLEDKISSDKVRQFIIALARLSTYSCNTEQLAAGAAIRQLVLANQGPLYLDNGWASIIESLQKALGQAVRWRLGAHVKKVSATAGGGVQIIDGEETLAFDQAVLCVPPQVVNELVPGVIADNVKEDILASKAACLDVCLKSLPVPAHTFVLGIDENLYYSVHSAAAKLAPAGGALIHTAVYLKNGEHGGDEHKGRLHRLLDLMQPGWREQLVYERFLPNMTTSFGSATAALKGANGLASPDLSNYSQDLEGVYVCGDWVGSGYLLADAAVDSALKVVQLIADKQSTKKTGQTLVTK
ncbi:MAG: NAD(P)/FAD-dependent oxidoreductase [Cyanobacteria bacterium SZAS TMP-1]|nr:NAD(P)/FAD-dependent oxidoreductase [Cyanobacteria bacterium SZAS TMP-1]